MRALALLITSMLLLLTACGGGSNNTPPTLASISVTPANQSTPQGVPTQFKATGTYSDGTSKDITTTVTWSSATVSVATIGNNSGFAMAVSPGSSLISATLGGVSGSTTLTVNTATLLSITVTPVNPSILVSQTQQFKAAGTYSDGTSHDITKAVTWTSGNTGVATIDGSGLASAVSVGSAVMTATSGNISGNTTLTVTAPVLQSIVVTPFNPAILVSQTQQFTATGTYSDGSSHDITTMVTWTSGNTGVATVNNAGLASAAAAGTTLITAMSGSLSGSTTLTVSAATLQSITATPANPSIVVPHSVQLTATGTYSDGSSHDITSFVTWSSQDTSVATVNSSGVATAVAAGTSLITATSGNVSGSTTLTVTAPVLQSITVTPVNPSVTVSQTEQFTATGTYSDGSSHAITKAVTWTSGNTGVATIDGSGLASAVSVGSAVMTATSGNISGNTTLTVAAVTVSSVSPSSRTLGSAGGCYGGTLTTTFQVSASSNVSWSAVEDANDSNPGGSTVTESPASGTGSGTFTVKITVPPQPPSSSYSNCSLQYNLNILSNIDVSFSDGSVVSVTVYWTFVGTT